MESEYPRSPDRQRGALRGVRGGGGQRGSPGRFGGGDRSSKQVNPVAEESKDKLPKGARWHDSKMASCGCRDPDCGTRQDVPFCQGCGMHGHDRPYCFKAGEPLFNPSGYWCVNRPNEHPIEGIRASFSGPFFGSNGPQQHDGCIHQAAVTRSGEIWKRSQWSRLEIGTRPAGGKALCGAAGGTRGEKICTKFLGRLFIAHLD